MTKGRKQAAVWQGFAQGGLLALGTYFLGLLVLAFLVAIMNIVREKMEAKGKPLAAPSGCLTGDCAHCGHSAVCTGKKSE